MSDLELRYWGDPALTRRADEVADIDGTVATLADGLLHAMREASGLGLAAPQVGVARRVFVYQLDEDRPPLAVVNPSIVETDGTWEYEEGCLSMPDLYFPIVRPKRIHLCGWGLDGRELSIEADELEARCLQHEIDHLDGRLLLDLLDDGQRRKAVRRLRRRFGPTPG